MSPPHWLLQLSEPSSPKDGYNTLARKVIHPHTQRHRKWGGGGGGGGQTPGSLAESFFARKMQQSRQSVPATIYIIQFVPLGTHTTAQGRAVRLTTPQLVRFGHKKSIIIGRQPLINLFHSGSFPTNTV